MRDDRPIGRATEKWLGDTAKCNEPARRCRRGEELSTCRQRVVGTNWYLASAVDSRRRMRESSDRDSTIARRLCDSPGQDWLTNGHAARMRWVPSFVRSNSQA